MALITGLKGGTTNITVSYGGKSATLSNFTVIKKTVTVTITAPTLKSVSPYTGSEQVLINEGSCTTGGTMYYYVSTSSSTPTFSTSEWTTTAPSKTDAGKYYLWYYVYVSDTDAYEGTGINTVKKVGSGSVTIPKQTGSGGTSVNNPSTTFSKSSQTVQLGVTGATGEVTYSTSITVKKGGNNITGWKCTSAGVVTIPASAAVGTYTVSGSISVAESTNYNAVSATSRSWTVTINKAAGSSGTANKPSTTFSTSSQTVQLGITGATGTVTYPTSIKIRQGSAGISNKGWSCTSAGVLTIPASTAVGTYRVTGSIRVAASTNYNSVNKEKTWIVTIDKADNPITITPTTATIYVHSSHTYNNTVQLSVSDAQGSVTYSSSATGKATVDSSSGLVTAVSVGTATITATAAGNDNYNSGTATCTVTIVTDTYTDSWNKPSISEYSYSNIGAGGGTSTPTVKVSQSGTRTWASGYSSQSLSNSTFNYSYSMTTGNGFSINTTNGNITADSRGTTAGSERSSNTATVTVTGSGSKSNTKTAVCKQNENALTGISISLGSSSINYNATTTATVTATYTSGSSKDVTSSLSTSSSATNNYIKSGDTSVVTIS